LNLDGLMLVLEGNKSASNRAVRICFAAQYEDMEMESVFGILVSISS
jgi:hypothetical protein